MASGWQQGRSTAVTQHEGRYRRAAQHLHEPGITIQKDLHQPPGGDIRNGWLAMLVGTREGVCRVRLRRRCPSCRVTAAIVILLMLAGLRLAQTDSETMRQRGRQHGFMWVREWPLCPKKKCLGLRNTFTHWQEELLFSSRRRTLMINSCD